MSGSEWLKAFFHDFASNPNALRAMGYSPDDNRLALLQREADLENVQVWAEATPKSGAWEAIKAHVNRHISPQNDDYVGGGILCLAPDPIRKEYIAGTYRGRIIVLDRDLSFKRYLGRMGFANAAEDTNIYVYDIRVSPDGSRIAICNYQNHIVRVYDYTNGDLSHHLFDIGKFNRSQIFNGQRKTITHPISVDFLPNGNIAVASADGRATDGAYTSSAAGYIAEYDGNTGDPVGLLAWAGQNTNGEPWLGGVFRPNKIHVVPDENGGYELWVSSADYPNNNFRDFIAVFDATNLGGQVLPFKTAYREPVGYPFAYLSPKDFIVDRENDRLIVVSKNNRCLVTIGLSDRELKTVAGYVNFTGTGGSADDTYPDEPVKPNGFHDPVAIVKVFDDEDTNKVWIANYANNTIQGGYLAQSVNVQVSVSIPDSYAPQLEFLPRGFDYVAKTWTVNIDNINDIKPFAVPMLRGYV